MHTSILGEGEPEFSKGRLAMDYGASCGDNARTKRETMLLIINKE
jgi:hypothetical protein